LAVLDGSTGSAALWQDDFALGAVWHTFGQQHFTMCNGQRPFSAAALRLVLSRTDEPVALIPNAAATTAATTILKIRRMNRMLEPEAKRSKMILCSVWSPCAVWQDNRFVFGLYRRDMKVIGCLGTLDRLFGVPVTTRNWNTIAAIARILSDGRT
jgi:hypothetical protein